MRVTEAAERAYYSYTRAGRTRRFTGTHAHTVNETNNETICKRPAPTGWPMHNMQNQLSAIYYLEVVKITHVNGFILTQLFVVVHEETRIRSCVFWQ